MILSAIYDPIFSQHSRGIPVAYLRALAQRESSMNPSDTTGPAWGLMQITEIARNDYNARSGEPRVSRAQLLDAATNVRVATWLLDQIVRRYATRPSKNLQTDWGNPEFVKLVTQGWNAGWVAVDRIASQLEASGRPVTHDSVHAAATSGHLANTGKHAWQRSVADLYFTQPDRPSGAVKGIALAAAAAFFGWILSRFIR